MAGARCGRGAAFANRFGCILPARFDGVEREWRAAREGCAVFDASLRGFVGATGADRVSFLQGMLSNDVKALRPGHGMHAAVLNEAGKIVSDLRVYADADRLILDTPVWRADAVLAALHRFLVADEVELARMADEVPLVGLEGPFARAILTEVLGSTDVADTPLVHQRAAFQGRPLRVVAVSEIEGSGYLLCGDPADAPGLFDACCEAGAVPLGMEALNILRVEAGVPWSGVDMDERVLALEIGLERALSFSKGCYLGQEVVERVSARGHVNRRLAGLLIEGSQVPEAGTALRVGHEEVGYITSAVRSIALERVIALGIVHRKHLGLGSRMTLTTGGGMSVAATVTGLPFGAPGSAS